MMLESHKMESMDYRPCIRVHERDMMYLASKVLFQLSSSLPIMQLIKGECPHNVQCMVPYPTSHHSCMRCMPIAN